MMDNPDKRPDLLERLNREYEFVQLLLRTIVAANASTGFEEAMRDCLEDVCKFMKWPVGHFYAVSTKGKGSLVPTKIWYLADEEKFRAFVEVTEKTVFHQGEGLPGEVLVTGKMNWIEDIYVAPNFPRARLARDSNVKSGFAFPVMVQAEIVGVMEFFSPETSKPDDRIVEVMANIGVQIGRVFERQRAGKKLKLLSRAVEQSLSSVMITDSRGVIEYVNPSFTKYTGYSFEEAVGKRPSILKSGRHSPEFYADLWATILSGKEWKSEVCNRRKNGDLYWEHQSISPMLDERGDIVNFISFKLDDTLRRNAVERLKSYAAELQRSNSELEAFAAIASHDLQEPLRKIVAFGDRLKKNLQDMDRQSSDYLDRMQKSAQRMSDLIEALLKYSRVTTQARPFEVVDLNMVAHDVLEDLELRIAYTKGNIELRELPVLEADPMQMYQLLRNLIGNSLTFHREEAPPVVRLRGSPDADGNWRVIVEDNGVGFDESHAERIFKPFERLHGHSAYEGNGMGLAICKKIVERHNGNIRARGQVGEGSTFIVTLPGKQSRKKITDAG